MDDIFTAIANNIKVLNISTEPLTVKEIYKEAFNHAYKEYEDPSKRKGDSDLEETSHKVAWSAVKKSYRKSDDGHWKRKAAS